jgi:hypothetical protein
MERAARTAVSAGDGTGPGNAAAAAADLPGMAGGAPMTSGYSASERIDFGAHCREAVSDDPDIVTHAFGQNGRMA